MQCNFYSIRSECVNFTRMRRINGEIRFSLRSVPVCAIVAFVSTCGSIAAVQSHTGKRDAIVHDSMCRLNPACDKRANGRTNGERKILHCACNFFTAVKFVKINAKIRKSLKINPYKFYTIFAVSNSDAKSQIVENKRLASLAWLLQYVPAFGSSARVAPRYLRNRVAPSPESLAFGIVSAG
jgi:hypothetical protein